ncbi:M15 family metallopeptidase [Cellulomonas sp. URHB0016]
MVHRVVAAAAAVVLVGGAVTGGAWLRADRAEQAADAHTAAEARVAEVSTAAAGDASMRVVHDATAMRAGSLGAQSSAADALAVALAEGGRVLAATDGAVADDATRRVLADGLAAAQASTGAPPLTVRATVARLGAATAAVTASHDAWAQQQAAAPKRPSSAAPTAGPAAAPTTGPTTAPSCATTYTGPPFYTSPATEGGDGSNGRLPPSELTAVSWDVDPHGTPYYLRTAAAAALERLDAAFVTAFGHHLDLDLTYRDLDTQVAMREALGSVAAVPGTSSHGTGLALDVPELPCEYGYGTPQRDWLVAHGPSYGWRVPSWATQGGSNPEYWHFEYTG